MLPYADVLLPSCYVRPWEVLVEGSLEVKLPTIWTDEKHSQEEAEPGRNSDVEKVSREKMHVRESRKVAKHYVFPMFCGSGGSKSRFAKAAGAKPAGEMRDEKLHAVVARGTFGSKKCQKLSRSEHFYETSKKCTPLWRETHFQVTNAKTAGFEPILRCQVTNLD